MGGLKHSDDEDNAGERGGGRGSGMENKLLVQTSEAATNVAGSSSASIRPKTSTSMEPRNNEDNYVAILQCKLQSLLAQFSHPQVRADFLRGKFSVTINPNLLRSIDELRWTLFPRWRGGELLVHDTIFESAARHVRFLISRKDDIMEIPDTDHDTQLSYAQWFDTLDAISSDKYWLNVPSHERCVHILSDEKDNIKQENVVTKHPRKKIEEIIISSSSNKSDSTNSSSESSSSESSDSDQAVKKKRYNLRKRKSDLREVVTPPPFDMNSKISFEAHFKAFESYFRKKYDGDSHDKTQKLEDFLLGELLTVYKARGGRKLKYRAMKKELLEYYKKQKVGGKRYWRKQFNEASPQADEKYDIYGMRLIELAQLAFPSDKKECAEQLRDRFLKTVPAIVSSKVRDVERSLRATKGKRKHISFSAIMDIAKDLQKSSVHAKEVMWADNMDSKPKSQGNSRNHRNFGNREFRNSKSSPDKNKKIDELPPKEDSTAKTSSSRGACWSCGNLYHTRKDCWRAKNACLICGKDHRMEECPRFDPDYKQRSGK